MAHPLMPKATAVWMVENTTLTFKQIADFCGLHSLEVRAIADGNVPRVQPVDPVASGELTQDEITRCEADSSTRLKMEKSDLPKVKARQKGAKYTPISKRQDKPNAIAWILKHHPELKDAQISRLLGTTKPTIEAVRSKSHWNAANITARNPVELGLCTYQELDKAVQKAQKKAG